MGSNTANVRSLDLARPGLRSSRRTERSADLTSEAALRGFIAQAPAPIAMFDHQMRYLVASRGWLDAFLAERVDVIGCSHYDLFPEISDHWKAVHKAGLSGQTLTAVRDPFLRADGRTQYVTWEVRPWLDRGGDVGGILIFCEDVTDEVAASTALEETAAMFAALLDAAPNAMVVVGADGRIELANRAAESLFGAPRAGLVGGAIERLIPPSAGSAHPEHVARFLAAAPGTARGHGRDVFGLRADGAVVPLDVGLSTVETPKGRKIIASIIDLSARKTLEAELTRKSVEAEAASVAKSEFLANMSHEIRTPLTGVKGFAALLERTPDLPPKARTYADRIARSADALTGIVTNILDFSQLEAGQITLSPVAFNVSELMNDVIEQLGERANDKGLRIVASAQAGAPLRLVADVARTRQVLVNLVTNAISFGGTGEIHVRAAYAADTGRLRLSVTDSGPGIAREDAERLFEPFTQADNSRARMVGGAGLGLAISKAVTSLMRGAIGVDSEPGLGSTFWFEIPAPRAGLAPVQARGDERSPTGEALRVLLVDDAPINRELISAMLSPFQMDITEVSGGKEAVDAANAQRFDIILMDVQMPGMDGIAAARAIRAGPETNRATPIIAVSANVLRDQVDAALAAGMNDYVEKPIRPADLLTKIGEWSRPALTA